MGQSARKTQSNILEIYYCNDMIENDTPAGDGHCEGKAEDAESRASECEQCGQCGRLDCQQIPGHGGRQRCLLLHCTVKRCEESYEDKSYDSIGACLTRSLFN